MRKLLWFTIGFSVGCGLCITLLWQQSLMPLFAYALVSGVLCFVLKFRNGLFRIPAAVFLGLAISLGWFALFRGYYLRPIQHLDGQTVSLSVTVTDYSEKTDYGYSVEGFAVLEGKPYRLRVFQKDDTALTPGDVLESDFRIRLTTPEGMKDSTYYQGRGLFVLATQKADTVCSRSERNALLFLPARVANAARDRIVQFFPEDTASFAKALLLGDTSDLSYSLDTALKVSGIRHVVAVSGLHVSILFGLIFLLFRTRRWLVFVISVPVLLFFAAVTGFSPSVTRACLMTGLMAFGAAITDEYDGLTSLSFAGLTMLLMNPFVLLSVSFQLSVCSVAGILLFASQINDWVKNRFPKEKRQGIRGAVWSWFSGSISVSVSALLFSVPLSAYYFGMVSLIGVLTNLLTIWVIGFLFYGIAAVSVLGGVLPTLCHWFGWLLSWPIRYVLFTAGLLSRIPFAAVYTQSTYITAWLVLCYVLLMLFLLLGRRHGRYYLTAAAACLLAAIGISVIEPKQDALRLNVLDVGEGQAILLQAGKENFLIDCGGSSDTGVADQVAQTLLSQGVFQLDGLALTHYDADHTNAIEHLLTRVQVNRFYFPDLEDNALYNRLQSDASHSVTLIDRDMEIPFGTGRLILLEPGNMKTGNENCMCVLFESEECVILITGDRGRTGEHDLVVKYNLPDVDILIAGHHGSKNSTTEELLRTVRPEIVIISVGENNIYGHPAQELLERLAEFDCTVYRTDQQGSVLVRR
ncbi:MAG: DNA internalization-related competence protein ComEC/Rec2 [Faecousia sp.]